LSDPSLDVNATDNDSRTALYHACLIGNIKIVEILCRHKDIKLNLADVYGNTPLMMAAFDGHVEVVKLLLSRPDIDVNVTDRGGDSALSHATKGNHPKIAQLIQEKIDSVSGSSTSPSGSSKYNISSLTNSNWIILLVSLAVILAIVSGIFGYIQFRKTRRSLDFGEEK
jgi:ankyrin repeat protein